MIIRRSKKPVNKRSQWGAHAVEFALVALVFFTLLIGIMEFGRWLFTLNAMTEMTRWGARLAVVCTKDAAVAAIRTRVRGINASIPASAIQIDYLDPGQAPNACGPSTCDSVRVSIVGATFTPHIPLFGEAITLPDFSTSLRRESMESADNSVCT